MLLSAHWIMWFPSFLLKDRSKFFFLSHLSYSWPLLILTLPMNFIILEPRKRFLTQMKYILSFAFYLSHHNHHYHHHHLTTTTTNIIIINNNTESHNLHLILFFTQIKDGSLTSNCADFDHKHLSYYNSFFLHGQVDFQLHVLFLIAEATQLV